MIFLPLIQYAVELLSFQADNFEPEIHPFSLGKLRKRDDVLGSNPVEITTLYRQDEPIPTAYSEPPKAHTMQRVTEDRTTTLFEENVRQA
jgi:hypothetical protein